MRVVSESFEILYFRQRASITVVDSSSGCPGLLYDPVAYLRADNKVNVEFFPLTLTRY